ncbi:Fur family transcriptional regulator [Oscillibacter ruminantium]|uniref:Fur family transcriptional regulator n=1 Tax=Oscillibacter ruminantium TaxID=1263547 RepID=UPI00031AAA8C|nr:transcriptional repressor [Oscillibacter ruminantium]
MKEYQTEQRKTLLRFFQENQEHKFSIDDIIRGLPPEAPISRSAIYRNLNKMVRDDLLKKTIESTGRKSLYQYAPFKTCCDRLHLRCEKCGKIMHLENESAESDLTALLAKNGFVLDEHATVLVGVCKECK